MERLFSKKVEILDCTIRDGGYLNNWHFDKKIVRETYRSLSKAGVDFVEIGYRGTEKYFNRDEYGIWRFSNEEDLLDVTEGIKGPKVSVMADYGKIDVEDFLDKEESSISLVRIASHKNKIEDAIKLLQEIKKKGYETSLQAMGYSSYSANEKNKFVELLKDSNLDYAYVADSYGSIFPNQIKELFTPLLEIDDVKIGFHPHNSLQMAFANSLEAMNCGVDIIDSSIFGMGRGAGNLPTEIMLAYLEQRMPDKFNVIPILNCIDRYFMGMHKEIDWGYQLPYMISGLFNCHPSYAQTLVNLREYTMEDIMKAMDVIRKKNQIGYSKDILEEIIANGIIGGCIDKTECERQKIQTPVCKVNYIDRHKGRTFLILANGPNLKKYREEIQNFIDIYDPICIGANYLGGLFTPHYHAFYNKRRFQNYIDTVDESSDLLLGQYLPEEMIKEYTNSFYEKICYKDSLTDFDISDGVIQSNCRTISTLLIGVAIVMGAENIFIAGMDGYMSTDENGELLFYKEKEAKLDRDLIIEMHNWNKKFLNQINEYFISMGKEGIHILTPTSYSEYYKGIKNFI